MPYAVPAPRYGAPSAWSGHVLWLYSSVFLLLLLAGAGVAFLSFYRSLNEAPIIQFFVNPPEKGSFSSGTGAETTNVSVSPDGRRLAFTARDSSSKVLLWVRSFDTLTSQPLAGTDGAFLQFSDRLKHLRMLPMVEAGHGIATMSSSSHRRAMPDYFESGRREVSRSR